MLLALHKRRGNTPTKAYDFTLGTLPTGVDFTRAGTRNFFNSSGVLASAPTGDACFEYDNNLACLGLSINDAATNICLQSNTFSSGTWQKFASSITASITGPDNTASAWKIVESNTTANHEVFQPKTITSGAVYVYSAYFKASERTRVEVRAGSSAQAMIIDFRIDGEPAYRYRTGTDFTNISGGMEQIGNLGWYRIWLSGQSTTTTGDIRIRLVNASDATNYLGDGLSGIYVYGFQLETGSLPTAFINTTTASASTVADLAKVTDISWLNTAKGTFIVETGGKSGIALGSGANAIFSASQTNKDINKIAFAWDGTTSDLVANGGSSTTGGLPTFDTDLIFNGTSATRANTRIRKVSYYNRRLTVAQLQSLTSQTKPSASVGSWRVAALRNKIPNATQTLSGTALNFYSRYKFVIGSGDLTKVKLSFSNFFGFTDTVGNAYILDTVSLEKETGSLSVPVTFSTNRSITLADGDVDILSDEILPSAFSATLFQRGEVYWVKVKGHVTTDTHKIPVGRNRNEVTGSQAAVYDPAVTTISSTDTFGQYTSSGTAPTLITFGVSPVMVGIYSGTDPITYFGLGDSIFDGTGTNFNGGYFQEAMTDADGSSNPLSSIDCSKGGSTQTEWDSGTKWKSYIPYSRVGIEELGTNQGNSALDKQQNLWASMRTGGIQVVLRPSLTPVTTSTDNWATEANQTAATAATKTAHNAFLSQSAEQGVVDFYEFLTSVRGVDQNKWKVDGSAFYATADGTHPSATGYSLLAGELRTLMNNVELNTQ